MHSLQYRRISQTSEFFDTFLGMLKSIHMANSAPMSEMLIELAGVSMDKHMAAEPKLRTFWNTYCCNPWQCWSLGHGNGIPSQIANNQPIETWHKWGVKQFLGKFGLKKSTATVIYKTLPQIMRRDGGNISSHIISYHFISSHIFIYLTVFDESRSQYRACLPYCAWMSYLFRGLLRLNTGLRR